MHVEQVHVVKHIVKTSVASLIVFLYKYIVIPETSSIKVLRFTFDSLLTWEPYIYLIC